ncbi:PP2C family protein-serine/threonine phosphatase [Methyloprofundus sp.]|uniref:PP2C family protein-serine/threonine phosphatase n=1 Tax=Methyloprofundus sp. TaxID=2020875 RepID=UPI003D100C9B
MNNTLWSSWARTHVGMVRKVNQDAFADLSDKQLWVVADGMGGHQNGNVASAEIVKAFKQFEPEERMGATVKKIYLQLKKVNYSLLEQAAQVGGNTVIGSTVAILYAKQSRCVTIWSGDSRIYLFRRGELKQLTRDHNNESRLLAEGFSRKEIKVHHDAQILTHAIGGEPEAFLDAQTQEVRHGDIFLLCSDGLNKEVTDSEIEEVLRRLSCPQAVNDLIDLALHRGGRDNITLMLVQASNVDN